MSSRAVALLALAALVASGCRDEPERRPVASDLVAFTVTSNLDISCSGIWTVDGSGTLRWLAGVADSSPSPMYPSFQHDGRLTVGFFSRPDTEGALPLIDILSLDDGQRLARDVLFVSFAWSPTRAQLLALVLKRGRKLFSLVRIDPDSGRTTTVAESAGISFSWLGEGDTVAYLAIADGKQSLWVANGDGTDARLLARDVERFAASPDGERIALRRTAKENFREELWVVDVETGKQRRVPGALLRDRSPGDIWLRQETLIVHDEFPGAGSESEDAIRVDLSSGARSLLAPDVQVLQVSSDESTLVAIRKHLLGAGTDVEEEVIAVLAMRSDGMDEQLLAVTDAQTDNIHGVPVLQPVVRELSVAKDLAPPPGVDQRCRSELIALRDRVRKG